jgi:carboxypeptidase T
MRSTFFFLLAMVVHLGLAAAQSPPAAEPYQEIRVELPEGVSIRDLLQNPELELMDRGDGEVRLLSRPSITRDLIAQGWKVDVLHEDLELFYASRQTGKRDLGAWHSYEETTAELELLHEQYPTLTTAPFSLGVTGEGREIWAIKVSDNPDLDEEEAEVLFDGLHHAREIMTVEMNLYFARYLCENYGTDPLTSFLVDNREIWFVPIVNPDGFVYNETTNPYGGGMWRKNRRDNGGCFGVDNNRNYPFEWVGPGSSTDPCSDVYRGPSAGSEPENQALMNLCLSRHFVTHDSWHSVAGMILLPWGYTFDPTPDDAILREVATERSSINHYVIGQAPELLYEVNGGSIDWMYGEQVAKPKIFSFSTEISGTGFWPDPSEKDGLIAENLHSILYLTGAAGPYATVKGLAVSGGDGNGRIDPGETVDLIATIRNEAVQGELTGATVRLRCDDPYIVLLDARDSFGTLPARAYHANDAEPFRLMAEAGCPPARQVTLTVVVDAAGGFHTERPFVLQIGDVATIAGFDFEEPEDAWIQDVSHTALSGAFVRVDPVATHYQPGDDTTPDPGVAAWITGQNPDGLDGVDDVDGGVSATRSPDFDLSGYERVRLSTNYFHGQEDTGDDPSGDFFAIEVSPTGGASWVNLLLIRDVATAPDWKNLTVDLGDYIPLTGQVRFRVRASDGWLRSDALEGGIDDFYLYDAGSANRPPSAPVLLDPPDGATHVPQLATLTVLNATDTEGDSLTYGFRIYADAEFTQIVQSVDGVVEGSGGATAWTVPIELAPGGYFWRSCAADPLQRGLYMEAGSFTVPDPAGVGDLLLADRSAMTASPNPAPGEITIRYLVPATSTSRLGIYDPEGRLVRSLRTVPSQSGWHEISWDGRDDAGRKVASGSYWVCLWTPGETRTVRVVTIR